MEREAQENLIAARALLEREDPCTNAATSRAYYAAYQACWTRMLDADHKPAATDRGSYFLHKELPGQARAAGVLSPEESEELEFLESQRVVADYYRDDVTELTAQESVASAQRLVARMLGGSE